jgi:hypothetical protein
MLLSNFSQKYHKMQTLHNPFSLQNLQIRQKYERNSPSNSIFTQVIEKIIKKGYSQNRKSHYRSLQSINLEEYLLPADSTLTFLNTIGMVILATIIIDTTKQVTILRTNCDLNL